MGNGLPTLRWGKHRVRLYAVRTRRGKAPAPPAPKGEKSTEMQKRKNQRCRQSACVSACEPLCARLIGWVASVPPLKDEGPCWGFVGLVGQSQKIAASHLKICYAKQRTLILGRVGERFVHPRVGESRGRRKSRRKPWRSLRQGNSFPPAVRAVTETGTDAFLSKGIFS